MSPTDDKRRPAGTTWHDRHVRPRAATERPAPAGSVEFVDDETTGELDTTALQSAVVDALREERRARHRLRDAVAAQGERILEHGRLLATASMSAAEARACAEGALLSRRLLRAVIAVAVLVPGAGVAAGKAFVASHDATMHAAGVAAAERDRLRADLDSLRAELAALTRTLAPARPAGAPP